MSDRIDEDLLDDPTGELRKGSSALEEFEGAEDFEAADEFEEGDGFDEADEADETEEAEAMDALDAGDEYEAMEDGADALDEESGADEFEEAMTDALEAGDTDEFFGGLGRMFKSIGRKVRQRRPLHRAPRQNDSATASPVDRACGGPDRQCACR